MSVNSGTTNRKTTASKRLGLPVVGPFHFLLPSEAPTHGVTMRLAVVAVLLLSTACATVQERRCSALQSELEGANEACTRCLGRLSPSGDAGLCQYVCAHSSTVAPAAVSACAPPAPVTTPTSNPEHAATE